MKSLSLTWLAPTVIIIFTSSITLLLLVSTSVQKRLTAFLLSGISDTTQALLWKKVTSHYQISKATLTASIQKNLWHLGLTRIISLSHLQSRCINRDMEAKGKGLRYLCRSYLQLVSFWRGREDHNNSKRTKTTTTSELFIVKLIVRYILSILSQHLWISYMNLMRNFAARKEQTTLHPSSYGGDAFRLSIRHSFIYLYYNFINEAFSLLWKVYLKTFQDSFRIRKVPSVVARISIKDLMF